MRKKTQSETKTNDEKKTQAKTQAAEENEIAAYATEDTDNYHYVLEPDDKQMQLGTAEQTGGSSSVLQYYRGNVRLDYQDGDYEPTKVHPIDVKFKFWINQDGTDANSNPYSFPEGLQAECWSWIHNQGYSKGNIDVTPSIDQGVAVEGKYAISKLPRKDTSVVQFLYSNIDWTIQVETVKGSQEDPVITWQKNNYASYLMSIENTSGLVGDKLPDKDNWVPDTTLFSNYDVTVEVPNSSSDGKAFANTSQYVRWFMNDDGSLTENTEYYDASHVDGNALYGGKWIANDLSNVGYDLDEYDNSGGAVILDVTDLSETDRLLEDPDLLIEKGAQVIGYQWVKGANFVFQVRNKPLYPPQFSSKYNDEIASGSESEKTTCRYYRVYTPFNNSVHSNRGTTVDTKVNTKGTIYFGGSNDAAAAQSLLEEENEENAVSVNGADEKENTEITETAEAESTEAETAEAETTETENTETADTEAAEAETTETETTEETTAKADAQETEATEAETTAETASEEQEEDDTIFSDEPGFVAPASQDLWSGLAVNTGDEDAEEYASDTSSLGHRWSQNTSTTVYVHIPEYQASGTKTVEAKDAYAGKELTYSIKNVGVSAGDGTADSVAAPMYRPNVVDTLPEGFDLQKLQFVLPESMKNEDMYKGYNTPADFWLGGTDDLLGVGIIGDPNDRLYSPLEYQDKNGDWHPVENLEFEEITDPEESITVDTENGTEKGILYSCDVKDAFETIGDYSGNIRINYRCYWIPLTQCVGYVRLVGVSRVAGERVNTAVTNFTILNYEDKRDQEAINNNRLKDQVGYFNVGLEDWNGRTSTPSEARKDVNKSDIYAKVSAETEIRSRHKVDDNLLEAPITMDYGNYLINFRNDSLAEGYNVSFDFQLEDMVKDEHQGASENSKVKGFMTEGIRISTKLLESGEQPYKRENGKKITSDPDTMLIIKYWDGSKDDRYTLEQLLALKTTSKDELDKTPNPHDEYLDQSIYINLCDEDGKAVPVKEIKLLYSSFYGKDELEKKPEGETDESEKNPQDKQWMRVYGTSSNICTADGTMDYKVEGWKNRVTGELVTGDENVIQGQDKGALKFVMANPTVDINVVWRDDDTKKDYSSKQQPVPYRQPFWYDITLGNDSSAILFAGHVNLELDMYKNSETPYDELKHKGFVMDSLEFDLSHMRPAVTEDAWANLDGIDFYDVENEGKDDKPKVSLSWSELQNYVDANTHILKLPRSVIYEQTPGDTDWQIGKLDIKVSDMDPYMTAAHKEDQDGDGVEEMDVAEKLFHCKVIGHASLYEKDLELKNDFTAETDSARVDVVYTQTATDDGGKDAEGKNPLGVKKVYVDPNANVTIDLKNAGKPRQTYYSSYDDRTGYVKDYFDILTPSGLKGYRKNADGTEIDSRKYTTYQKENADLEHTIRSNLTNYLKTAPANSSSRASALIAGELEMEIPAWLNDGASADVETVAAGSSNILGLLKGRKEGFVAEKIIIPDMPEKTGKILSITMEGYKPDGTLGAVHEITEGEILSCYDPVQKEYVIPASMWETQGSAEGKQQEAVLLPAKYTVKFENFSGNVQANPVYVDLVGYTPYGGNYLFKASFHTEDKRPAEVENKKDTKEYGWGVTRPAEEYYDEDKDQFYLCTEDTKNLYLDSDAYYKAYQASSSNARKLMGYDQHGQTIHVPYNEHTKEFHYYIGSKDDLPLTQGTLMAELPVTKTENGTVRGFLMDELRIDKDQLAKFQDIYSIEIGGIANKQRLDVQNGLESDAVMVLQGRQDVLPGNPKAVSIDDYMDEEGNLVIPVEKLKEDTGVNIDGVRYVRIRFINVKPNTNSKTNGVEVRILGSTNVYADENALVSRATLMRPKRYAGFNHLYNYNYQEIGCGDDDDGRYAIITSPVTKAYMYVEKPHPYGFVTAIFDDEKLSQKGLTGKNNYGGSSMDADRWYSSNSYNALPANPFAFNAPLGNLQDLKDYDRYQHSFLFTFGNQLIQGYKDTGKQNNDYSYSDIPNASFKLNVPKNSTYTGKLGFSTTEIVLDHDLEKYGTKPSVVIYRANGDKLCEYTADDLKKLIQNAAAASAVTGTDANQYTGIGITPDDRDVRIQIIRDPSEERTDKPANVNYLLLDGSDKDTEIGAIEIKYETYYGNEHISKTEDDTYTAANPADQKVLKEDDKQSTQVVNIVNRQNWIRIYGKPGTYNDDEETANNKNETGKSLSAVSEAVSDLTNEKGKGTYFQWKDTDAESTAEEAADRNYTLTTSFLGQKAVPVVKVLPYGTSNGKQNYDTSSDPAKRTRNASMGGKDAWYGIELGNTGYSRIYQGILDVTIPITSGPSTSQKDGEILGYEVNALESDDRFITNITRTDSTGMECIYLDTVTLVEHKPIDSKKSQAASVTISAPKDANGNTIYPTKDTLGSTEYTLNYADENGNTSVSQILASDFIQDDGSGNLILSLDDKVWSSEAHPLSHVKYLSVKVGNYGSFKEDTAASHVPDTNDTNLKLGQNESLLKVKGTVTGYLYEENEDGSVNADSKVIQDLKAEARWNSLYEEAEGSSTAAGTLMRTSQSEGYLHLDPSEPTLSMIAVKDQKKGDPDLDISYENKNNTYYRAALGNDSDSGMSQPILRVELPLNDDAPKFETDKTKADTTIKTNAPQEEKRRGFQMTKIRLDKKLLEVAKLSEIRIYDRLETVKDEEQKDVPKSYVIDQETLKQYLDHPDADGSVTIPYDAWYHPNSADDTGVKYPAAVELVFGSFAGSVGGEGKPDEDYGHVELEGEINRYGDEQTYPQEKTQDPAKETNNLYDNSLRANASFIDYVAGTNTPIESKDQEDAKASASFFVKEPLPKLTVENQYYKGATENVVPYSREYLSVFGITNDSISRMENFRFVMTPEMGQKDDSTTGEEKNRGFHTLDMIIRNKLFEEAVFDKITIEDAAKNRRLTLKRKDFTAPTFGLLENDRNPYITLKAATEGKAEPKNVNENIVFDVTLTDLNGNPVSDVTLTTTALSRRNAMTLSDADDRTTLARGLYNVYAGDLVIPRTLLVKEAGLSEISQIIVEGSDFKAMRSDENKETARTSYSINNKQDADGAESIIFVGISDKEIKGETDQINSITDLDENGNVKAGTTTTENVGVFNAYLYSHTYDQWKDENKTLSGTQDQKDNNFAQIADDNHRRSDTQSKLLFTPKLFFDTTISAVFKDSNVGRFTDETLPMYQNLETGGTDPTYNGVGDYYIGGDRSKRPWSNKYHAPAAFYKDNLLSTLGYKSLAAYTVDFRQLGKLSYGNNSTIAKKYPYRGCNGKLQSLGTVAEDYNAAANVEMAVSLPDDSFDAYFIKLRPALKPFVNSIRVYKTDGTFYTITPESEKKGWWKDNAQDTMANGTNRGSAAAYKVSEDGNENWWRINLLTDEPSERYENDITYVDNDLNDEYEARDLVGTSSEAHKYYQTPSKVTEKGSIKAVVINMSVNRNPSAKPAEGEAATLWDAITADEGSWYKEDADPETLPGSAPYNYQYQVQNQETRHSMEIAGRVIHVGRQEAKVGARLELGSQFNMMSDTSKDPVVVRDQDKVSRIRVQRSQFYDELEEKLKKDLKDGYSDDSFAEHTEEVDGQPKASVRTLNSSAANYEKSSWSYRNWFAYETVCYNHGYWYTSESRYLDWHAAHLEDKTQIQVLNPDVRQDKGLGNTSGTDAFGKILSGYPFGTASGNVQLDYSSLLPYYGTLRGYGIGVFQAANSGTEDTRGRGWGYSDLKEDWYGRITHTDFVSMYDKLPYIGRQDGWYTITVEIILHRKKYATASGQLIPQRRRKAMRSQVWTQKVFIITSWIIQM